MSELSRHVGQVVRDELGVEACALTDTLADLGADSLDVVDVVLALEESFGFEIDDGQVTGRTTVGELVALVEEGAGA